MIIAKCQEVQDKPTGCTHVYLNTIGEIHEWLIIEGDKVRIFSTYDGWIDSQYEKTILLSARCIGAINA